MMRIWGLLKPQSLPVFSRSDENLDVLLQSFKLLTRLALNPNEPDEYLLGKYFPFFTINILLLEMLAVFSIILIIY